MIIIEAYICMGCGTKNAPDRTTCEKCGKNLFSIKDLEDKKSWAERREDLWAELWYKHLLSDDRNDAAIKSHFYKALGLGYEQGQKDAEAEHEKALTLAEIDLRDFFKAREQVFEIRIKELEKQLAEINSESMVELRAQVDQLKHFKRLFEKQRDAADEAEKQLADERERARGLVEALKQYANTINWSWYDSGNGAKDLRKLKIEWDRGRLASKALEAYKAAQGSGS